MARRKKQSETVKKAIEQYKNEQETYTDLEQPKRVWKFKNPNRKVMIGRIEITQDDLDRNQETAQYLISKGLEDLLCFE